MSKSLNRVKRRLLKDAKVRAEYAAQAPEFALARELIRARTRAKLTQEEVAARMGTTQSAIARLESGRRSPSLTTLRRFAEATGSRTEVRLVAAGARPTGRRPKQHVPQKTRRVKRETH